MPIEELGHTGLWVNDLAVMRDFYERVLGLTVTDEDEALGIVFLSSRPEEEPHEFVLQSGRLPPADAKLTHQIWWRVDSLETLREFYRALVAGGTRIQQVVTHGNAFSIYFFDPEGNQNEVYWPSGVEVPQPFRKSLDVDQEPDLVFAEAARLLIDSGPPVPAGPVTVHSVQAR
jgi:catechol-2,3-dioxygenase